MQVKELCSLIDSRREELYDLLCSLIRINSENFGSHGNEQACPAYVRDLCLELGLDTGAAIRPAPSYPNKKVVFYGSSITQGACASRPGNSYEAMVARRFGFDYVNLGFSGNAKGEDTMAAYIAGLDMDVFVYDYDHNAPTLEHLAKTHEPFFNIIREKRPDLPVVMISRPSSGWLSVETDEMRRDVVLQT